MKKLISLCLIGLLVFSMFGCKREADTDDTAVNIIENETPSDSAEQGTESTEDVTEDTPEQQPLEDTPETTLEEQLLEDTPELAPDTETKTEQPEEETETTPEKEEMTPPYFADVVSPDDEPAKKPYEISIDEDFTDDRVLVYIKRGYSAIKQDYTPEDFPYLELEKIVGVISYRPEDNNNILLSLRLKYKGKQNVIDAIEELRKDARVLSAFPNWYGPVIR